MIQSAQRIENYHYAIRHLAGAAEALTRAGREVIYLNIGDPQVYGFRPPGHIVEPVIRALRNSFTGYTHSAGLSEAREAVANYATRLGAPTSADQVLITSGASEAADILLTALLNESDEVLLPAPGYPIYPAILSKLGGATRYYHLDGASGWQPSVDEMASLINPRTRALVLINLTTEGIVSPFSGEGSTRTENAKRSAARFDVTGATINIGSPSWSVCTATAGRRPLCSRRSLGGRLTSKTSPRAIYSPSVIFASSFSQSSSLAASQDSNSRRSSPFDFRWRKRAKS
jgi:hypothetical protein